VRQLTRCCWSLIVFSIVLDDSSESLLATVARLPATNSVPLFDSNATILDVFDNVEKLEATELVMEAPTMLTRVTEIRRKIKPVSVIVIRPTTTTTACLLYKYKSTGHACLSSTAITAC